MAATNIEVWQEGMVVSNSPIATGINLIEMRQPEPVKAEPGTHIDVLVNTAEGSLRRSYSIVKQSEDLHVLTLGVFQVPNSRGGSIAMHQLEPGTVISMTQPLQNFPLRIGASSYVLIAGGIGITALSAMAQVLKSIGANYKLHYSARSQEAMAFESELREQHGERLLTYIDDQAQQLDIDDLISTVGPATEVYICGPIRMMDAIRRSWKATTLEPSNLRYETFGASGWFDPEEFVVRIPAQNVEVLVGKDVSMLEALEQAGVDMLSDCRKGECGLCEVRVSSLSGQIDHRDVFYSDRQKDSASKMSCCVSRVVPTNTSSTPAVIDIIST